MILLPSRRFTIQERPRLQLRQRLDELGLGVMTSAVPGDRLLEGLSETEESGCRVRPPAR